VTFEEFASALGGVRSGRGYSCFCPAHEDEHRSLSVNAGTKYPIIFHCNRARSCSQQQVIEALKARGLWPLNRPLTVEASLAPRVNTTPAKAKPKPEGKRQIAATYSYVDEDNRELFQCVRFEPKGFAQRHRGSDGRWIWNLTGIRRVLYYLPRVMLAVRLDKHIFICEGEKDADALACEFGVVTTTCPMGAEKWLPEYNKCLYGARVVVLPDWDKPGIAHAKIVVESLQGIARSTVVLSLTGMCCGPYTKCDVSDWLSWGGDLETFKACVDNVESP
jgi:hypothetical protein